MLKLDTSGKTIFPTTIQLTAIGDELINSMSFICKDIDEKHNFVYKEPQLKIDGKLTIILEFFCINCGLSISRRYKFPEISLEDE